MGGGRGQGGIMMTTNSGNSKLPLRVILSRLKNKISRLGKKEAKQLYCVSYIKMKSLER